MLGGNIVSNKWKITFIALFLLIINVRIAFADVPFISYQNEAEYPPFRYIQDNHFEGFEVDLSNLIFRNDDYNVKYSNDTWDRIYERLIKGEIDTCGMLAVTEDRKDEVLFSKPVLKSYISIYTKKDGNNINLNNLKDYKVAVGKDQFAESLLRDKAGISDYVTFTTINEAIDALAQGKVDALFENQEVVNYMLIQKGLRGVIIPAVTNLFPVDISYGVKLGNQVLVDYINKRVEQLQSSGVYEELYQKYFYSHSLYYEDTQRKKTTEGIIIVVSGCAVVFLALYIYIKFLKKKIFKINKELYERHKQLRVTLSSIIDGVVATDGEGKIEYINKTAKVLTGLDENIYGNDIDETLTILSEDTRYKFSLPIRQAIDECRQVCIQEKLILKSVNGLESSVEVSAAPITNDENETLGTVVVFHDVTETKLAGDIIRQEKGFSKGIMEYANIFILVFKPDGTLLRFNKYAQTATGFSSEDVAGMKWMEFLVDKDYQYHIGLLFDEFRSGNIPPAHEMPIICRCGKKIHVLWTYSIVYDKDKKPDIIIFMGVDISERKAAEEMLTQSYQELEAIHEELAATEEELRAQYDELEGSQKALSESEERYRLSIEGAADGLWDYNIRENKSFYSNRCREILGYKDDEIPDNFQAWTELIHPEDKENYLMSLFKHVNGKTPFYRQEYRLRTKDGGYKWVLNRGKAIWDNQGEPVRIAGSLTDITERKLADETIYKMAFFDFLTGLPNRTMFFSALKGALSFARGNGKSICLFFLDLDNFKSINDTIGHVFGDQVLKAVGEKLRQFIHEGDTVARLSGDEFVLLLTKAQDEKEIINTANGLMRIFQQPFSLQGHEVYITASIGISIYPRDGSDEETLIRNADIAMYCSKEQGKNNYQFYGRDMNTRIVKKLNLENSLRYAIKHREFSVFYQPLVDITTGDIVGVEALVRWFRPGGESIPPMDFIPVAESTGLIVPIGEFVLRTACAQNKAWQDAGYPPVRVSVNLSARQFQQPNLDESIKQILDETGLAPQWLSIEITESVAIQDLDLTIKMVERLKTMGIEVSLDDFGTGYSSLNYLKKLPIDTLKIDKSFIHDIAVDSREITIINAVILLAHSMELKVVAEGVETTEQLGFLKDQECDRAQGYYFSKPLPPLELEKIMKNGRAF